ncbi:MAG: hypothetical protein EOP35_09300, partial [Rubrivivax sp.]
MAVYVLAGVNGAGKSSLGGAAIQASGAEFFNPDIAAARLREQQPGLSAEQANGLAWTLGRRGLEAALAGGLTYAFETTLGGHSITRILLEGARVGLEAVVVDAQAGQMRHQLDEVAAAVVEALAHLAFGDVMATGRHAGSDAAQMQLGRRQTGEPDMHCGAPPRAFQQDPGDAVAAQRRLEGVGQPTGERRLQAA